MRTIGLQQQGIGGIGGVGGIDGVSADLDAQLAQLLSGGGMDVAALGIKKGLDLRGQHISISVAMLNRERDSTQKVIDSIST